jgi:hypothetical protein
MAPGVLHRVIHGTHEPEKWQRDLITVRPAMLQNYRRHKVRDADYPAIIPHQGSQVRGSLVTGLNEQDIRRLDVFEGSEYAREKVEVEVLKNVSLDQAAPEGPGQQKEAMEEVEADVYVWLEDPEETLEPEEWDFEAFKRDKMHAWMGLPTASAAAEVDQGFADVDAAVATWDDQQQPSRETHDPTGGRGANGHITQQLRDQSFW